MTSQLEGGDRQKAMKRLRVPPLNDQQSPWITFKVGFFLGACLILMIAVALSAVYTQSRNDWRVVFRLYRGSFLVGTSYETFYTTYYNISESLDALIRRTIAALRYPPSLCVAERPI